MRVNACKYINMLLFLLFFLLFIIFILVLARKKNFIYIFFIEIDPYISSIHIFIYIFANSFSKSLSF